MSKSGLLQSYDAGTHTAVVELTGSIGNWTTVPVNLGLDASELTAGRRVLVVYLDDGNPDDCVLTAVWE